MNTKNKPLSPSSFSILFALSLKPRHGYELMQQVGHDSGGRFRLGPGTLYSIIKQLCEENLIEEIVSSAHERRRYYQLALKGWSRLESELKHYENVIRLARERGVLGPTYEETVRLR